MSRVISEARAKVVERLLLNLQDDTGEKVKSYGENLRITESQLKALTALNYIYPQELADALYAIDSGRCTCYTGKGRKVWVVDFVPVCLSAWLCSCREMAPPLETKWDRVCEHLLAAHLLECNLSFLDSETPIELEPEILSIVALDGPEVLRAPCLCSGSASMIAAETGDSVI